MCIHIRLQADMATAIMAWEPPHELDGNIKFFWKKLLFR